MRQWVQKFLSQLEYGWGDSPKDTAQVDINEDRATLLYIIDTYNKNLIDIDTHPVRKVREILDEFAKELVSADKKQIEKVLFKFRQFFSHYRVDEYTYVRKTFDDFKGIIWDFVDQLSEDFGNNQADDDEIHKSLEQLKEAVEADSIDVLRAKSREFIDFYVECQTKKEVRRSRSFDGIKKNLDRMQKKLNEANHSLRIDHLTQVYNRKSFDEHVAQSMQLSKMSNTPTTLMMLDIDYFKRINDTYGHDIGDFILVECARTLQKIFSRDQDFVARVGGEEFAVILQDANIDQALKKAEEIVGIVRKEVFVKDDMQLRFTLSMGIAQLNPGEPVDQWIKRADEALYKSKNLGRDRYTVAQNMSRVA